LELHIQVQNEAFRLNRLIEVTDNAFAKKVKEAEDERPAEISDVSFSKEGLSEDQIEHRRRRLRASAKRIQETEHRQLVQFFPRTVAPSLLVALYSFFEHTLSRICDIYEKSGRGEVEDSNHLSRYQKYLKNKVEIDFPDDRGPWHKIKERKEVRNCIAHDAGRVPPSRAEDDFGILDSINKYKVKSDENGFLQITKPFLKATLDEIDDFFDRLFRIAIKDADPNLIQHMSETKNALQEGISDRLVHRPDKPTR
jgi:hypothetical protein